MNTRKNRPIPLLILVVGFFLVQGLDALAAEGVDTALSGPSPRVDIQADSLEYDADRKLLIGVGNVTIDKGPNKLSCDYVEVETESSEVYARGNIIFDRAGRSWTGEEVHYNFETEEGDFGEFQVEFEPYFVQAEDSERVSSNEFRLYKLRLTTCAPDDHEYSLRAREGRLIDGKVLKVKHAGIYLGPVPILYMPWAKRDFSRHTNIDVTPGYSSESGALLLTGYNYRMNDYLRGTTHVDYRSKRGIGFGQDFKWQEGRRSKGQLRLYYLNDDEPFDDAEEEAERGDLIDSERYRARLSHSHNLSDSTYLITELNYLSDPDVLEDFFDREFRKNAQPENRVSLLHREDNYTIGAEVIKRLNDFYESVDRTPEVTLDVNRQEIGSSGLYYENENSLSRLERVYEDGAAEEDYDSVRMDTYHLLTYPMRYFGFLNLIPQAGVRGTYYSDTPETTTETVISAITDTNGVVIGMDTNMVDTVVDGGSEFRTVFDLAVETSFKAFKEISPDRNQFGRGLRHVAEPYIRHSLTPTPSAEPDELYQFDGIDAIDQTQVVRLGVRNKLQTRRNKQIHDLLDIDLFTDFEIDPESEQDIGVDAELSFVDWWSLDFDASYNVDDSTLERFSTQIGLRSKGGSTAGIEYRFVDESRDQVALNAVLFPDQKWSYTGYWRYDLDNNDLEEHRYEILHKMDCLGWGIGVKEVDQDLTVWAQLWILALPKAHLDLGR